jgi:aryl-alcohol dehydrogenase-like predicted oxidoreductase
MRLGHNQLLLGWADRHNGTYRVGSFFQFAPTTYIRADSRVNHIDTADVYGPHVTNQIIRKALSRYPDDLVIVTKLGAGRTKGWILGSSFLAPRPDCGGS